MTQYLNCCQLKDQAKDRLRGNYKPAISLLLISMFISQTVSVLFIDASAKLLPAIDISEGFVLYSLIPRFLLSLIPSCIISSIMGILNVGIVLIFLKISCNQKPELMDLFHGFREDTATAFILSAIQVAAGLLLQPYQLFIQFFRYSGDYKWIMFGLLALLIGYALYLPLALCLDLSYDFMLDFPEKTPGQLIGICFRTMRGHKLRLLRIWLSFLPLIFLGICTFYIGFLWIQPYIQMTYTQFYLDLMKPGE